MSPGLALPGRVPCASPHPAGILGISANRGRRCPGALLMNQNRAEPCSPSSWGSWLLLLLPMSFWCREKIRWEGRRWVQGGLVRWHRHRDVTAGVPGAFDL